MPNPWLEWLESRPVWNRWQHMHQIFGKLPGDQACKGCTFLECSRHRSMFGNFYTIQRCTRFPSWVKGSGKHWDLNYPACGLWKKREKK